MNLRAKELIIATTSLLLVVVLGYVILAEKEHLLGERQVVVNEESAACVNCHGNEYEGGKGRDPGLVHHWQASVHAENGVGCADCHGLPQPGTVDDLKNPRFLVETVWDKASGIKTVSLVQRDGNPVERPDIWQHEGMQIVVDVSPRTCAQCHEAEAKQFLWSRHNSASRFIGSLDNFLGRFAEGPAAANSGCQQCHGSIVRLAEAGVGEQGPVFAPDTWPNTGIGRVNLDGSWGSCSACHSRHEFSAEIARRPENCGKCHMGPDHPQIEIFHESKHGVAFAKNADSMNMDAPGDEWVLGDDYSAAPTCSTCHMGAVATHANYPALAATHDVGARISWTLRPKVSIQPKGIVLDDGTVMLKDPLGRRDEMKQTCLTCHGDAWVDNFYVQFDQAVELYNHKFGQPSMAIYQGLGELGLLDTVPMNEEMDYLFFELWHHEGRRARHGASMMGPDYVQWHGFYELSRNFYTEFLPLSRELAEHAGKQTEVEALIEQALHGEDGGDWDKYHRWTNGLSAQQRETMLSWEQDTYGSRK